MRRPKIVVWDGSYPLSMHLLITTKCNLDCPECFYKKEKESAVPPEKLIELLDEWRGMVECIAIGGGEPLMYPHIGEIVAQAKMRKFFVAITTNGTINPENSFDKRFLPDRVHVSYDEVHNSNFYSAQRAIENFRSLGVRLVGVNHILSSLNSLKGATLLPADTFTLLIKKPFSGLTKGEYEAIMTYTSSMKEEIWWDACISHYTDAMGYPTFGKNSCRQGVISMALDQNLHASICSNDLKKKIKYTNLKDTWKAVKSIKCPMKKTWEKEKSKSN